MSKEEDEAQMALGCAIFVLLGIYNLPVVTWLVMTAETGWIDAAIECVFDPWAYVGSTAVWAAVAFFIWLLRKVGL